MCDIARSRGRPHPSATSSLAWHEGTSSLGVTGTLRPIIRHEKHPRKRVPTWLCHDSRGGLDRTRQAASGLPDTADVMCRYFMYTQRPFLELQSVCKR